MGFSGFQSQNCLSFKVFELGLRVPLVHSSQADLTEPDFVAPRAHRTTRNVKNAYRNLEKMKISFLEIIEFINLRTHIIF